MANQSLSFTPSFLTDYFPYNGSFFVRVIPADGSLAGTSDGSVSIAYLLNVTDPVTSYFLDDTVFQKQIEYFLGSETKFYWTDGTVGLFLKGLAQLSKPSTVQFLQEGTAAVGDIKLNANVADGVTLTLGLNNVYKTYRFKNTLAQVNDVKIGTTASDTLSNLNLAINLIGTAGVNYYAGTQENKVFSSVLVSSVLTYTDRVKCKRIAGYFISASSYSNIVIRTPIGGVDGSLLLEIPPTSYSEDFTSLYTNSIIYSFGRKETYSSIDSLFIPLLGQGGSFSPCFNSDLINLSGSYKWAVGAVFNPNSTIDTDYYGDMYYLLNGSTRYAKETIYTGFANWWESPIQMDNVRVSLGLRTSSATACCYFKATVFY